MTNRVKLTIEYIGTNYCGWQLQNNGPTVQEQLENALASLYEQPIRVYGVGRTDEGVHARGYVCHYDAPNSITTDKIVLALNRYLPCDISASCAEYVDEHFHARKSALSKRYVYNLYVSRVRHALLDPTHLQVYTQPNITLMREGAQMLIGTHDFGAFAKLGSNNKTTVRTVYSIEITQQDNIISIAVVGNAFLYNMVRNIVGVLLFLSAGKITLQDIGTMLDCGMKTKYYKTVSGKGLVLDSVQY
ncbi:MAG: tRNA pseudouridine(38-40) synthase TruA [Clostridia bacterium]|nr:tRNA pseudouridine(38-40) synthase TruA [Clostridia bacterium]